MLSLAFGVSLAPARKVGSTRTSLPRRSVTRCVQAPPRTHQRVPTTRVPQSQPLPELITREAVRELEAELDSGASLGALRRFNKNLRTLPADQWAQRLRPVFAELVHNLESFNPAFTAVLLRVQSTIGTSDYRRRDMALKNLIVPLAGEYGMHNGEPQAQTHRELFADFYQSLFGEPLSALHASGLPCPASEALFSRMMADIMSGGGARDAVQQAVYAMGYNLAIEYLADYEKTWMLDSFRDLYTRVLKAEGREIEWTFLEIHAEGEAEHAAIGHNAVLSFVPAAHRDVLLTAMRDHDRDFATFYNHLADMLE